MARSRLDGDGAAPPRFAAVVNPAGRLADGVGVLGCSVGRGLGEPGLTEAEAVAVGAAVPGEEGAEDPDGAGVSPFPLQAENAHVVSSTTASTILAAFTSVPLSCAKSQLRGNLSAARTSLVEAKVTVPAAW